MYMHRHHKAFNENSNYNAGDKIARLFSRSEFGEKMLRYFYFLCLANLTELSTFHRDFSETHPTRQNTKVRVQISRHAARPPAIKLDTATQLRGCSETRCSTRQRKRRSSGGCGDKRVLSGAFLAPTVSSCGTGSRNGLRLHRPHRRTAPTPNPKPQTPNPKPQTPRIKN